MKIKTKLIISFCMIIFVPLFLAGVVLTAFCRIQVQMMKQTYGIRNADVYSLVNSVQLLNRYTAHDFEELQQVAKNEPDKLMNLSFLSEKNAALEQKYSYLVVRVGKKVIYNGAEDNYEVLAALPDYGTTNAESRTGAVIDSEDELLIKQIDYETDEDKQNASIFIVTSMSTTIPETKATLTRGMVAIVLILLLTACMMIMWIYRSMIEPLRKLQVAAENIKEGNLDFEMEVSGEDEIGELCKTFEQMRQRLKSNAEEKLANERENKMLVSNIAHDLKTPITAIKGYSEGILDGVANTPEKREKYIRTIYNKANEMDTLINELTLYSKIDTNRIPYNFTKLHVVDYFNDCVEEIGIDLEAKEIGLSYNNFAAEDTLIIADPEQLRRVIHNIIGNSVKYMNKTNGQIQIRVKDVGDFIQVEIEDNGKGIAQKDLPHIFDRFYRADASRNSATGGSGIGLSIVRKIIEDHGGKIWATSKEDVGTIMYFVIRKYEENIAESAAG